jgi:hypothetical protein
MSVNRLAQSSTNVSQRFEEIADNLREVSDFTGRESAARSEAQANILFSKKVIEILPNRSPWIMSTTEWLEANPARVIVWAANPSEIAWSMPLRATETKNKAGTVYHVWRDPRRQTFYDEPVLSMSLQSGNIMPVTWTRSQSGYDEMAQGLSNFYQFMELVDAPKLTADGRPNLVSIQYTSRMFPKITLIGLFNPEGIRFNDSSSEPNQVNSWSATFTVYDSVPRLSVSALPGTIPYGDPPIATAFTTDGRGFRALTGSNDYK